MIVEDVGMRESLDRHKATSPTSPTGPWAFLGEKEFGFRFSYLFNTRNSRIGKVMNAQSENYSLERLRNHRTGTKL
jgi:hypothetical protein